MVRYRTGQLLPITKKTLIGNTFGPWGVRLGCDQISVTGQTLLELALFYALTLEHSSLHAAKPTREVPSGWPILLLQKDIPGGRITSHVICFRIEVMV